jgi:AbrB family looped-hinge helix DNA binding protein
MATITSKRQLTIPADLFRELNLETGDKMVIEVTNDKQLKMQKAVDLVEKLAGSVSVPEGKEGADIDKILSEAKKHYFNREP